MLAHAHRKQRFQKLTGRPHELVVAAPSQSKVVASQKGALRPNARVKVRIARIPFVPSATWPWPWLSAAADSNIKMGGNAL